MRRRLNHRRSIIAVLSAALLCAGGAWAYWVAPSSGSAGGHVGSLGTPSILTATPGTGTVALSWEAVSPPGTGTVQYYLTRDGGAPAGNCPSSTSRSTQTSCTDAGLAAGTHKYLVTAVYRTWTSRSAEASANVAVGAVDHLVLGLTTTTPTAGAADNLTITAKDSAGTTVASYGGSHSLTFAGASAIGGKSPAVTNNSGTAVAFGTAEPITFTNGVATVTTGKNGAMTLYKAETAAITVTDGTVSNGSGSSVTVSPASTSAFSVPAPASVTAGKAFEETLTAVDQYGNTTPSLSGSKTMSFSGPASVSPNGKAPTYPGSVTFSAGVGTTTITLVDAQTTTLTAKERSGSISGTSASFTVAPASASALSIAAIATQAAGTAFGASITAVDAYGNTQPAYEGAKAITFTEPDPSPSGKTPEYPAAVTFTAGKGTASPITLYDAESTPLKASDGSISGTSSSFTVRGASTPASFAIPTPSAQTAGTAFEATITAKDTYGNTADYTAKPAASFSGPSAAPGGKAPSYPTSINFSAGIGPASITLYDAQSTTLSATIGALSASTGGFAVGAAATSTFAFAAVGPQTAGSSFEVTLSALDLYGNLTTSYSGPKTITWTAAGTSPGGRTPSYQGAVNFTAGVAGAALTLYAADTTTTVSATQGTVKGTSPTFAVAAAGAAALSPANPGERTAGSAFNETLTALDAYGNTAAAYEGTKAITFSGPASSPAGRAPSYPASVTFTAGTGTATGITLYNAAATTLGASDGSNSGTSTSFTVAPASASGFALSTPAPTAGSAFSETLTAKDAYGNTATGYSGKPTVLFSGPASSPSGKGPAYPAGGSITFNAGIGSGSITLYNAAATTLTATQGTITGSSASFNVSPAAAATLALGSIATQTAGSAFTVTLTGKDAYGNALEGPAAVSFKGPAESPSREAPAYPASVTFGAGSGSASVTLYDASAATTLSAEAGTGKATSASFAVNALAGTKLAWASVTGSGAQESATCLFTCAWGPLGAGKKWNAKVSVTDLYGNIVSAIGSGHSVELTKTVSGASLSAATLALPASGEAVTATSEVYTSASSGWTSDTVTAKASGYTDATATLKK